MLHGCEAVSGDFMCIIMQLDFIWLLTNFPTFPPSLHTPQVIQTTSVFAL